MLDNTLVVWGREMGTTSHKMQPVNLVLAGGARGALPTGRFLDRNREPHAKLLVSICRLMGLADVNGVGDINAELRPARRHRLIARPHALACGAPGLPARSAAVSEGDPRPRPR